MPRLSLLTYVLVRIGRGLAVALAAIVVVFVLMRTLPGDPAAILGDGVSPATRDLYLARRGLDQPVLQQLGTYLAGLLRGDLGETALGRPVGALLGERLPLTFRILCLAVAVEFMFVGAAVAAFAMVPRAAVLIARIYGTIMAVVPLFLTAILAQEIVAIRLGLAPAVMTRGTMSELFLPGLLLGAWASAFSVQVALRSLAIEMRAPYVRYARAKGAGARVIVLRHAVPNAAGPILAFLGVDIATLIAGSVIIEALFNIPGFGLLVYEAIQNRDVFVVTAAASLTAVAFAMTTLLADLTLMTLDPRVRDRLVRG